MISLLDLLSMRRMKIWPAPIMPPLIRLPFWSFHSFSSATSISICLTPRCSYTSTCLRLGALASKRARRLTVSSEEKFADRQRLSETRLLNSSTSVILRSNSSVCSLENSLPPRLRCLRFSWFWSTSNSSAKHDWFLHHLRLPPKLTETSVGSVISERGVSSFSPCDAV